MQTIMKLSKSLIFCLMLGTTLSSFTMESVDSCVPFPQMMEDGGIVVVMEGFTDQPIEVVFESFDQKNGNDEIEVVLKNAQGRVVFEITGHSTYADVADLKLPAGRYELTVKVNGALQRLVVVKN